MKVFDTEIEGVKILEVDVHRDARGYFAETYNAGRYAASGIDAPFVQDNESFSQKGVLRGLHWQAAPWTQAKLVRVIRGAVWDLAVDIRKGSATYGRHVAVELTGENSLQFYVPQGFAHGFLVLENDTLFAYKCDNLYHPEAERGMKFDDSALGIPWPDIGCEPLLSPKDQLHPLFEGIVPWEPVSL